MNYNSAKQKRMLLKAEKAPPLPPRAWIETQCLLYVTVLQQYLQAYADHEEATARADECLDNVFNKYRQTERDHPHRRAFLKQLRAFLRTSLTVADASVLKKGGDGSSKSGQTTKQIVARHLPALLHHLETLSKTAEVVVRSDVLASDCDTKRKINVNLLQRMRESWHRKRVDAKESLKRATTVRNYPEMNKCRVLVDKAEQMCLYYGRFLTRTKHDSTWAFTVDDAMFAPPAHKTPLAENAAAQDTAASDDVKKTKDVQHEPLQARQQKLEASGPFLTLLHDGLALLSCEEDEQIILQAEKTVASALKRFVGENLASQDYAGTVELAAFLEAVTDVRGSTCPLFRLLSSLHRAAHAYQLAYISLVRGALVSDVQTTLCATLPRDVAFETAVCPDAALDLRSLSPIGAYAGGESRVQARAWLQGNASRVDFDSEQVQEMIETLVANLPTPFQIVRGINDPRAHQLRRDAFAGRNPPRWNDVCHSEGSDRDAIMKVLRGVGRSFSREELCAQEQIRRLFLAEPGCFHIQTYHANCNHVIDPATVTSEAVVRISRPHVTLTHAVLAPGVYVLSKTIYLPGIDKGKAVAVRSHILEDLPPRMSVKQKKPLYETHVYASDAVERVLKETPEHWTDVYDLTPLQTLHAGNATLFMAASVHTKQQSKHNNNQETGEILHPLGFVIAGSAGKCLLHLSDVKDGKDTQVGYLLRDCKTYTQSVYVSSSALDALYIDSLCGSGGSVTRDTSTNSLTPKPLQQSQKVPKPRGVGYFLMAQALAYHARAQPSGVRMNVRCGTGKLGKVTVDASVAFYYYRHFHMRVVSQSASLAAHACGLEQLEKHYSQRGSDVVTKRQLKRDGVYSHVCNIVSCVQERGATEESPISIQTLCGSRSDTETYRFLHDFISPREITDSSSSGATPDAGIENGLMFRSYPHLVEIRLCVLEHFEKLCSGKYKNESKENTCSVAQAKTKRKKGWQVLEEDSLCCSTAHMPAYCDVDDEEIQCADSISESLGAW